MARRRRANVAYLVTTDESHLIDVYVKYDQCYGGFYVAAWDVYRGRYVSGHYVTRWILETERPSQKKLERATAMPKEQIERRSGPAWEAVDRLCGHLNLVLKADEPAAA